MLLPELDLHSAGPLALGKFSNIFLPNIDENQKNSYHLSAGNLALCHMVNAALLLHFVQKKVRWEPKIATFRTTTVNFIHSHPSNTFKFIGKNWSEGAWASWLSILLLITIVRVLCCSRRCQKKLNLKKEQTFLSHFCHWWQFNWGEPGFWAFPG